LSDLTSAITGQNNDGDILVESVLLTTKDGTLLEDKKAPSLHKLRHCPAAVNTNVTGTANCSAPTANLFSTYDKSSLLTVQANNSATG